MSETDKKGLMDKLGEKERAVALKHPFLGTAAITVATMAAAKPAKKAAGFVGKTAKSIFSGSKGEAASDVVAAGSNNMAKAAFKGGGSEEAAGLAASGLVSLVKSFFRAILK